MGRGVEETRHRLGREDGKHGLDDALLNILPIILIIGVFWFMLVFMRLIKKLL